MPPPSSSLWFDCAHHWPPGEGENLVLPLDGGGAEGVIEWPTSSSLDLFIGPKNYLLNVRR